jgi:hypothetical protein
MQDLLTYRQYDFHGIKVTVKIDRIKKAVSLVEYDQRTNTFKDKKWEFIGRELGYMNGWLNILSAMKYAIGEAKKELEAVKEEDMNNMVKMMVAIKDMQLEKETEV